MRKSELRIGDRVYFGTSREQTKGRISRLDSKTATIITMQEREGYPPGSEFLVPYNLILRHAVRRRTTPPPSGFKGGIDPMGRTMPRLALTEHGRPAQLPPLSSLRPKKNPRKKAKKNPMRKSALSIGQVVYFGTKNGPRTRAKILRLNKNSVTVVSTAKRGDKPAGSQWRVGYENLFAQKARSRRRFAAAAKAAQARRRRSGAKKNPTKTTGEINRMVDRASRSADANGKFLIGEINGQDFAGRITGPQGNVHWELWNSWWTHEFDSGRAGSKTTALMKMSSAVKKAAREYGRRSNPAPKKTKTKTWNYTGVTSTGRRLNSQVKAPSKKEAVEKAKRVANFKGKPLVSTFKTCRGPAKARK